MHPPPSLKHHLAWDRATAVISSAPRLRFQLACVSPVARVRASGSRMMAWITYGGLDGAGALGLEGGALFSFYNTEMRNAVARQ
eukprot:scaffold8455_cov104-Isochrysis_galbana.AAC.6